MQLSIADLVAQYQAQGEEGTRLMDGLSAEQANWSPAAGRWSVLQCLDHLCTTFELYRPKLDQALERAESRGAKGQGPFEPGWIGKKMIRRIEPPPNLRLKAPRMFQPQPDLGLDEVGDRFAHSRQRVEEYLGRCEGLDMERIKLGSPATSLIRMRLITAFAFLAAHERRHLWQARQVREDGSFPAA